MFTLERENGRFFRIKRGLDAKQAESELHVPVKEAFAGKIIPVSDKYTVYVASVGENYRTIALKTGVSESELKEINGGRAVYPSARLFVPDAKA